MLPEKNADASAIEELANCNQRNSTIPWHIGCIVRACEQSVSGKWSRVGKKNRWVRAELERGLKKYGYGEAGVEWEVVRVGVVYRSRCKQWAEISTAHTLLTCSMYSLYQYHNHKLILNVTAVTGWKFSNHVRSSLYFIFILYFATYSWWHHNTVYIIMIQTAANMWQNTCSSLRHIIFHLPAILFICVITWYVQETEIYTYVTIISDVVKDWRFRDKNKDLRLEDNDNGKDLWSEDKEKDL